jgi:hypothetical protein
MMSLTRSHLTNRSRIHQTLRVTPAMETGIIDHVSSLDEVIDLI